MHIIFPGSDFIKDIVSEDLIVFNNASNLKLLHSIGDLEDLGLLVPYQTIDFQGVDPVRKRKKIETCLVDLHLEDNNRFGDRLFFLLLGLNLRLGLLGSRSSSWLAIAEEIDLFFFLLCFLFGSSWGILLSPCLKVGKIEGSNMKVPEVYVGMSVNIWEFYMKDGVLPMAR